MSNKLVPLALVLLIILLSVPVAANFPSILSSNKPLVADSNPDPVAVAGGPYTGQVGVPIEVDGSRSYSPPPNPGDPLPLESLPPSPKPSRVILWMWDFGDGTEEELYKEPTAEHTYTEAGTYTVKLTVVDDRGDWDVDQTTATINGAPTPTPTPTPTPSPTPTPVPTPSPSPSPTPTPTPTPNLPTTIYLYADKIKCVTGEDVNFAVELSVVIEGVEYVLPGKPVKIEYRVSPAYFWNTLARGNTDRNGAFNYTYQPGLHTYYEFRAVFVDEPGGYQGSRSTSIFVSVS
jgi:hypothetical protein